MNDATHADRVIRVLTWLDEQPPNDENAHEEAFARSYPSVQAMRRAAALPGSDHDLTRVGAHLAAIRRADMGALREMGYPVSRGWEPVREQAIATAKAVTEQVRDRERKELELARRLRAEGR